MRTRKRKPKFYKRVVKAFSITLLVMVVVCGSIVAAYAMFGDKLPGTKDFIQLISNITNTVTPGKKQERITVLVIGEDRAAGLTDVMLYATVDLKTSEIDIVSMPRDTRVEFDKETYSVFKNIGKRLPEVIKMNEAANYYSTRDDYSASENKMARYLFSKKVIEYKFGVKFDYFVQMDLSGFRKIVDSIGGVPMDVPRDMNYVDPFQDLNINIKKGQQILSGAQAEDVVRFRYGYSNGDLGRIEMQQLFMKAFVKEMLNDKNQLNKAKIITKMFDEGYILTDLTLKDALLYAGDLINLSTESFQIATVPGEAKTIGRSYFVVDQEGSNKLFADILGIGEKEDQDMSSKDLNIEILNGTNINGLAGEFKEKLEDAGFEVFQIGNFSNNKSEKTRIIVKKQGQGTDLEEFFNKPEIAVEELPDNVDIRIIIGDNQ